MIQYLPYVAKGVGTLINYFGRKKKPPAQDTALWKYLSNIEQQGMYSPTAESKILGRIGAEGGNVASQERGMLRGMFLTKGMGGSVATTRTLLEPGQNVKKALSVKAGELVQSEEQAKKEAGLQKAQFGTQYETGRIGEEQTARQGLLQEMFGVGTGAVETAIKENDWNNLETYYKDNPKMLENIKMLRMGVQLPDTTMQDLILQLSSILAGGD